MRETLDNLARRVARGVGSGALFLVVEPDAGARERLVAACPRSWFYLPLGDAQAALVAAERLHVAGAIVSDSAPNARSLVRSLAARGVPVMLLACGGEADGDAGRDSVALCCLPHPARVLDARVALAARLEEIVLAGWLEHSGDRAPVPAGVAK